MQVLDLNIHGIDEVTGKAMILGGAQYVFQEMIAEGGQSFVFPITNYISGISWFVAKICKWKPGTEEYEREKRQAEAGFRLAVRGVSVIHTENHEIPGGLIRLEQNYGQIKDPAYKQEAMKRANTRLKERQFQAAIAEYDEILKSNPNHNFAMINRAACYIGMGRPYEVVGQMQRALQIEPNERMTYHQTAHALVAMGAIDLAIETLDRRLNVYKWDFDTWNLKMQIAADANKVSVLEEMDRQLSEILSQE